MIAQITTVTMNTIVVRTEMLVLATVTIPRKLLPQTFGKGMDRMRYG